MRKFMDYKVCGPAMIAALVLAVGLNGVVGLGGCSDSDKNLGSATSPFATPTVVSVLPMAASTPCPTVAISATFSKPMNPATINASTFTVSGGVTGPITADATNTTFTLTPTTPLTVGTQYTATITTGARDPFGNALAAAFTWAFTPGACPGPAPVGTTACTFGVLAGAPSVTNVGASNVQGDVGVWPGILITGFPPGTLTGMLHTGDAVAQTAQSDLTTAYNHAAAAPGGATLTADIGGQTKTPGVYKAATTLAITGKLTLDANGDPNAVWIFQVGTALTTAAGMGASQVVLVNGAQAKNVNWQVGGSVVIGAGSTFAGNILAQTSITLGTGATLNGRALAGTGPVTMDTNTVTVPACP